MHTLTCTHVFRIRDHQPWSEMRSFSAKQRFQQSSESGAALPFRRSSSDSDNAPRDEPDSGASDNGGSRESDGEKR
ncbi:uncharacterized protein BDZ99DRAFT_469366 [Mytilinidion resinicola]|uniref:Uncharacterized protein n=1 Tax=Mytilinidion resinicola TaxID=574789 RepID=A0A6A6Y010_9PEZI|nr:uncharacterized protein BDZ99DRAFT_469366 [Mytilinidion resinicola]KAF2801853.1 hypothetical protein BDZ99DRAFT_469366 [Mytilinidion resinicola]